MRDTPPDWSAELRTRLAALRLKPEREADIVEELSQHLDDRWCELVAGGASAEQATRTIEAELANRDRLKDYLSPLRQAKQPPRLAPGAEDRLVVRRSLARRPLRWPDTAREPRVHVRRRRVARARHRRQRGRIQLDQRARAAPGARSRAA